MLVNKNNLCAHLGLEFLICKRYHRLIKRLRFSSVCEDTDGDLGINVSGIGIILVECEGSLIVG